MNIKDLKKEIDKLTEKEQTELYYYLFDYMFKDLEKELEFQDIELDFSIQDNPKSDTPN